MIQTKRGSFGENNTGAHSDWFTRAQVPPPSDCFGSGAPAWNTPNPGKGRYPLAVARFGLRVVQSGIFQNPLNTTWIASCCFVPFP